MGTFYKVIAPVKTPASSQAMTLVTYLDFTLSLLWELDFQNPRQEKVYISHSHLSAENPELLVHSLFMALLASRGSFTVPTSQM